MAYRCLQPIRPHVQDMFRTQTCLCELPLTGLVPDPFVPLRHRSVTVYILRSLSLYSHPSLRWTSSPRHLTSHLTHHLTALAHTSLRHILFLILSSCSFLSFETKSPVEIALAPYILLLPSTIIYAMLSRKGRCPDGIRHGISRF